MITTKIVSGMLESLIRVGHIITIFVIIIVIIIVIMVIMMMMTKIM